MAVKNEDIDYEALGNVVSERKARSGLTNQELAQMLDLSPKSLSMMMRGSRRISPRHLSLLLKNLDISESEIPLKSETRKVSKGKHVFISYSHRDTQYLERLLVHLKPLERAGLIDAWADTRLLAGDKWRNEITKALNSARVAILMISADFLASDFVVDNELPPLLAAAEEKGTIIIPVILKPCRFTREKILREFQSINQPDSPLSLVDENEQELVYDTVAQRVELEFDR